MLGKLWIELVILETMDGLITFCAKYLIVVSLLAAIYLAFTLPKDKRRDFLWLVVAAGILSFVLAKLANHLHQDPRPFMADPHTKALFDSSHDNGFPSDHTLLAALLGFASVYYSRKLGVALLIAAILVAWGRVAGHVHHLQDVIGSFVITALATYVTMQLISRMNMKKTPPKERPS